MPIDLVPRGPRGKHITQARQLQVQVPQSKKFSQMHSESLQSVVVFADLVTNYVAYKSIFTGT